MSSSWHRAIAELSAQGDAARAAAARDGHLVEEARRLARVIHVLLVP
ncbi:hypothetical protein ABZ281_16350 [Streptomyces sp. NPDC006265]